MADWEQLNKAQGGGGQDKTTNVTESFLGSASKSAGSSVGKGVVGGIGEVFKFFLGGRQGLLQGKEQEFEKEQTQEKQAFSEREQALQALIGKYDEHVATGQRLTPEMYQEGVQSHIPPPLLDAINVIADDHKKAFETIKQLGNIPGMDPKTASVFSAMMASPDPQIRSGAIQMLKSMGHAMNLQQDLAMKPKIEGAVEEQKQSVRDVHEPKRRGEIAAAEAPYKKTANTAQAKEELEGRTREMALTNAVTRARGSEARSSAQGATFDANAAVEDIYGANKNAFNAPTWTPESVPQQAGFAAKDGDKVIAGTGFEDFLHNYSEAHPDDMPPQVASQTAMQLSAAWEAGNVGMFKKALATLPTNLRTAIERVQRDAFAHSQERARRGTATGTR